jgi:hypothetical protein
MKIKLFVLINLITLISISNASDCAKERVVTTPGALAILAKHPRLNIKTATEVAERAGVESPDDLTRKTLTVVNSLIRKSQDSKRK